MSNSKPSIGIIGGGGFVGKILRRYFPQACFSDRNSSEGEIKKVLSSDVIFIAVNFKDNCMSDESKEQLHEYFRKMPEGRVVIIKSTFVPNTTDYFQEKYPALNFVYNPEFLTEMTAWEDFSKPQFQILGLPHQSLILASELFELLPDAPVKRIVSPRDAEILKHALNSFYALKVTWFNQLYDACEELVGDYETVREIMVQNPWVGDSHSAIFHKGYRGYGGKCLSKDPKNLASSTSFPLINHIEEYNAKLGNKN